MKEERGTPPVRARAKWSGERDSGGAVWRAQLSSSVVSDSLQPHGPQHARPPCLSPIPRVYSNSCTLRQWCHPTISSSVIALLLPPSIFPSIRVFSNESVLHIRWPKYWSFSFSISTSVKKGWFPLRLTGLISLQSKGLSRVLQHHSSEASVLWHSAFFVVQLSHPNMTTGKTIALIRWAFVGKVMSLLFNMLSRLVIAFPTRNKHLLISWLKSPSAVISEPRKIVAHCFHCFPIHFPWSDGTRCHDLHFLNVEL